MQAQAPYPNQAYPGYAPPNAGHAGKPNMGHGDDDCGCGPDFKGGYPGGAPYGQMPQMGSPYGMGGYGQQQPSGGQMFNRPEEDED
ncbi:hypothetical protein QKW52_17695 [Bacillus sonorensis]|nr:hypothetical protein [Bacillus sonorensis]